MLAIRFLRATVIETRRTRSRHVTWPADEALLARSSGGSKWEPRIIARDLTASQDHPPDDLYLAHVSSLTVTSWETGRSLTVDFPPLPPIMRACKRGISLQLAFDACKPRAIKLAFDKAAFINKWLICLRNIANLPLSWRRFSSKRVSLPILRSRPPDHWYDNRVRFNITRQTGSRDRADKLLRSAVRSTIVCTRFLRCIMATVRQVSTLSSYAPIVMHKYAGRDLGGPPLPSRILSPAGSSED